MLHDAAPKPDAVPWLQLPGNYRASIVWLRAISLVSLHHWLQSIHCVVTSSQPRVSSSLATFLPEHCNCTGLISPVPKSLTVSIATAHDYNCLLLTLSGPQLSDCRCVSLKQVMNAQEITFRKAKNLSIKAYACTLTAGE